MTKRIFSVIIIAVLLLSTAIGTAVIGAAGTLGDVDGDGEVAILDATAIQRHLAGIDTLSDTAVTRAKVTGEPDDDLGVSVDAAIIAVGGLRVPAPERADLILAVNTRADGKTFAANSKKNSARLRGDVKTFMRPVKKFLDAGYPVAVADISFSNGADNSLMAQLQRDDLQYKIRAYGGWNTATNSTGFVIGAGGSALAIRKFLKV